MDSIAKLYEFLNSQYSNGFANLLATTSKDLEGKTLLNFKGYDGTILSLIVSESEVTIPPVILEESVAASAVLGANLFTAVKAGEAGNSIALTFDGILKVSEVVSAFNLANPDNQVGYSGSGDTIHGATTITLSGGVDQIVEEPEAGAVKASAVLGPNTFTAVNAGVIGNSIALNFDGLLSVQQVVDSYNTAYPANQVSFIGDGATIPVAGTVALSGGLDAEEPVIE